MVRLPNTVCFSAKFC